MTNQIPHYIEQSDPGFHEFSPEDLEVPEETIEQKQVRAELLGKIAREFDRLNLDGQTREYLAHHQGLGSDPARSPLLDLRLFLDWLRRLETECE